MLVSDDDHVTTQIKTVILFSDVAVPIIVKQCITRCVYVLGQCSMLRLFFTLVQLSIFVIHYICVIETVEGA